MPRTALLAQSSSCLYNRQPRHEPIDFLLPVNPCFEVLFSSCQLPSTSCPSAPRQSRPPLPDTLSANFGFPRNPQQAFLRVSFPGVRWPPFRLFFRLGIIASCLSSGGSPRPSNIMEGLTWSPFFLFYFHSLQECGDIPPLRATVFSWYGGRRCSFNGFFSFPLFIFSFPSVASSNSTVCTRPVIFLLLGLLSSGVVEGAAASIFPLLIPSIYFLLPFNHLQ